MKLDQKTILRKGMLFRWEIVSIVICCIVLLFGTKIGVPFSKQVGKNISFGLQTLSVVNKADSIATAANHAKMGADNLDSLMRKSSGVVSYTEGTLPGKIYEIASSSSLKATKVEISVATVADNGKKIPVRFSGEGSYVQCGRFIDGVENLSPAVRIKQLNLKNTGKGTVSLFLDFALLCQSEK